MQVWEAINILESLDPKSEVTLVLGKALKPKDPMEGIFEGSLLYGKTNVIGKEQWPQPPSGYPAWHHTITCTDTKH